MTDTSRQQRLHRLLKPQTVAVFGGDEAAAVIRQCRKIGFDGELWAVNPKRDALEGVACVREVADLPAVPDASFIAAPPEVTIGILAELDAAGAGGAVCYSSGFAEIGASGGDLQQSLGAAAGDMPVVGPNCYGFLNYLDNVALWPDEHGGRPVDRGVALILQSGNIGISMTLQQRGLDVAYVISIGNASQLGVHDYIAQLLADQRVSAIGVHLEAIADVAAFSRAALAALEQGVPIVALKTGRSEKGKQVTLGHTASLSGTDRLYQALFDRLGVARAQSLTEWLETLKLLHCSGPLPAATIASMSCSGGEAAIIADAAAGAGLDMPTLSTASSQVLAEVLGDKVHIANPLDYHTYIWGDVEALRDCFSAVLSNGFGCTLLVLDYPALAHNDTTLWEVTERALIDAQQATGHNAVVVATLPENLPAAARERLTRAGIAPMQGIEDCVRAIRSAAVIGAAQRRSGDIRPIDTELTERENSLTLDEHAAKQALAAAGVPVPASEVVAPDGAVAAADRLGYPVALKALSADLAHKTEAGAVALNLAEADAVARTAQRLSPLSDQLLIEQMVTGVVAELIVGINNDSNFGLSLLLGAGGTQVELLNDTVTRLLPITRDEIRQALRSLKTFPLLDGYRGAVRGDLAATLDAIEAIAGYAESNADTLLELDVNPLLVLSDGAIVVDALIAHTGLAHDHESS